MHRLGFVLIALGLGLTPAGAEAKPKPYQYGSPWTATSTCQAYDGDTLTCHRKSGPVKIRLVTRKSGGIDAPELTVPCQKDRGIDARDELRALLHGGPNRVYPVKNRRDKYGRTLAAVTVNKLDVGQDLINQGLVHLYDGGKHQPWPGC